MIWILYNAAYRSPSYPEKNATDLCSSVWLCSVPKDPLSRARGDRLSTGLSGVMLKIRAIRALTREFDVWPLYEGLNRETLCCEGADCAWGACVSD